MAKVVNHSNLPVVIDSPFACVIPQSQGDLTVWVTVMIRFEHALQS